MTKKIHIETDKARCIVAMAAFMAERDPEQMFYILFTSMLEIAEMLNMEKAMLKTIFCEAVDGSTKITESAAEAECQTH